MKKHYEGLKLKVTLLDDGDVLTKSGFIEDVEGGDNTGDDESIFGQGLL